MSHIVPRMTEDELREFVLGYCDGTVFCSADVHHPHELRLVFMPLAFGGLLDWTLAELDQVGVLWERLSKAGPRSINRLPMFFSFNIMHAEDWKLAMAAIEAEIERRKSIKVLPDAG